MNAIAVAILFAVAQAPAPPPFSWSIPEVIDDYPIGGTQVAGGQPMKLRSVRSKWSAERLIRKLTEDFLAAKLYLPAPNESLPVPPHLAAIDGKRLISYTVFFQKNADGTTTLILGEVDMRPQSVMTPIAPTFPGAMQIVTSDVEAMRTVSFRASATPAEVRSFYREVLGRAGYAEANPDQFVRGTELLVLNVQAADAGPIGVLLSSRTLVPDAPR